LKFDFDERETKRNFENVLPSSSLEGSDDGSNDSERIPNAIRWHSKVLDVFEGLVSHVPIRNISSRVPSSLQRIECFSLSLDPKLKHLDMSEFV
jgi:hypothetical protein